MGIGIVQGSLSALSQYKDYTYFQNIYGTRIYGAFIRKVVRKHHFHFLFLKIVLISPSNRQKAVCL